MLFRRSRSPCECCGANIKDKRLLWSHGLGGNLCIDCYENGCVHELSPVDRWVHSTKRIRFLYPASPCPDCGHPMEPCGGDFVDRNNPPEVE